MLTRTHNSDGNAPSKPSLFPHPDSRNEQKDIENPTSTAPSSELKDLLSPEKALYLLYNLVDQHPDLWYGLHRLLTNENPAEKDQAIADGRAEKIVICSVLQSLRDLQLQQLPVDNLCSIIRFLSWSDCLKLCATSTFFCDLVPKYITDVCLQLKAAAIHESVYKLLHKCQRLKRLTVDAADMHEHEENDATIMFPFSTLKSLQQLILDHVTLMPNPIAFDNNSVSALQTVALHACNNIDSDVWIPLLSKEHSPKLTSLTIRNTDNINHDIFLQRLALSPNHSQLRFLSFTVHDVQVIKSLRRNQCLIRNLHKLEIGLLDRETETQHIIDFVQLFRCLSVPHPQKCRGEHADTNQDASDKLYSFENLEILLIDFCPSVHSRGFLDISPRDLQQFGRHLPQTFPAVKLLGLYGSHSPLSFDDQHLHGFLRDNYLPQIIDLSIGFEELTLDFRGEEDERDTHFLRRILNVFPNLAWLTLENDQFLIENRAFERMVSTLHAQARENIKLQWITLCASEKDEIETMANGLFVEYWDRGIEQCDFDAALKRSQQIVMG